MPELPPPADPAVCEAPDSGAVTEQPTPRVLLTGATGYVGGRLLPVLRDQGYRVRCMARKPEHLPADADDPDIERVRGDVLDRASLFPAMRGVTAAYYLIHSMGEGDRFTKLEALGAHNFAEAARREGVERIVYLGGLGDPDAGLSAHLRSRQEVGRILRETGPSTIELRASIILGSGSLSFEMLRALVQRLPVMTTPRWVRNEAQPIAIEDVIDYLCSSLRLELEPGESRVYEIGGPDRVSYGDLMRETARQRGLRRLIVPVPLLSPGLSSLWLGLVTPVYARIGRKLIDSVSKPTVVRDDRARRDFAIEPRGASEAIARALRNEDSHYAQTRWSDALSSSSRAPSFGGKRFGKRLVDIRTMEVAAPPASAFGPVQRIGGEVGWYYGEWLWAIRGWMDVFVGGPGLRRGRRHPVDLRPGESLDFWRVEAIAPPRLLRLRAEMKTPGRAWLQFEVEPIDESEAAASQTPDQNPGASRRPPDRPREDAAASEATAPRSRITQTAIFDPAGVLGPLYWYASWPLHQFVFNGMLRGIARAATRDDGGAAKPG